MREALYNARSEAEFKRIKRRFGESEPEATERMLKDPDIMYTIPAHFSQVDTSNPNERLMAEDNNRYGGHSRLPKRKEEKPATVTPARWERR